MPTLRAGRNHTLSLSIIVVISQRIRVVIRNVRPHKHNTILYAITEYIRFSPSKDGPSRLTSRSSTPFRPLRTFSFLNIITRLQALSGKLQQRQAGPYSGGGCSIRWQHNEMRGCPARQIRDIAGKSPSHCLHTEEVRYTI